MAELEWDLVGDRQFEAGLDRGVFYPPGGTGVPWNGLVSVDDGSTGQSVTPIYVNGVKVFDHTVYGDYTGTLRAYTYPDIFQEYEGVHEYGTGVFLDDQPVKPFGLSYRTLVATADGSVHYKIHVLYNLTAVGDSIPYESMNDNVNPILFSWQLSGVPVFVNGRRPTVHFIFDSATLLPVQLAEIEGMLYGTPSTDPYLPDIMDLLAPVTITIVDNGDGTWSATGPSYLITMLDASTFQIENANAVYLDADTYTIRSS